MGADTEDRATSELYASMYIPEIPLTPRQKISLTAEILRHTGNRLAGYPLRELVRRETTILDIAAASLRRIWQPPKSR